MRIDITSFFFNTTIPEATATAAWGTSAGQSKNNGYKIKTETFGLVEFLVGMNYKVCADIDNLDISKMSKNRELLYFSIFDKVFMNCFTIFMAINKYNTSPSIMYYQSTLMSLQFIVPACIN